MEGLILLDSSVLIDYFRKINKSKTFFFKLASVYNGFAVPVVIHYEIIKGSNQRQATFWNNIFADIFIFPYTVSTNTHALSIGDELRKKRKSIDFKDLVIASIAVQHQLPLATLNRKHFDNISGLELITPVSFE